MAKAKNTRPARPAAAGSRPTGRGTQGTRAGHASTPAARRAAAKPQGRRVPDAASQSGATGGRRKMVASRSSRARAGGAPAAAPDRPAGETDARRAAGDVGSAVARVPERGRPGADRASGRGRYVYCIIKANKPLRFGAIGMDELSPDVYTVNYRDLGAITSEVPTAPLEPTRENVLAHERVNETVMREHTVIPMSFGTIFKTHEDILELLRSAYEAFSDVLRKMEDKLEFGLKVLWDRDEIVRLIEEEDEDIHRLKSEISSQKGSTYFARMQYGRMIDDALQQRSERYVTEFLRRLRDVSVASRVNRAIGDRMILNAAFLVQREQEEAFDRRIKEIASAFDKLTFKYTGPWPPYNFVNIRLKLERAGQH